MDPGYHGYKFQPTDLEIIMDYLECKMESRNVPSWPIHEVDFYNNCTIQELTDKYEATSDNKWYFASSSLPKRKTHVGGWKKTHMHTVEEKCIYNEGELVGYKLNFEFLEENLQKTEWLMQAYFTEYPILRNSSGSWVLGKIYKKEDDLKEATSSRG